MTILGNVLLTISILAYLFLILPAASGDANRGANDGGAGMFAMMVTPVVWLTLSLAFACAILAGAFDWLFSTRGPQFFLLMAAVLSVGVIAFFDVALWREPVSQIPWAMRPLMRWSLFVIPPIALIACLLALNPKFVSGANPWIWRAPMLGTFALSLLTGVVLLGELFVSMNASEAVRVQSEVEFQNKRDAGILAEVEAMETEKDFGRLLQFTNRFEKDNIRELALRKVLAHPRFTQRLAECLRNEWVGEATYFVDAHDAPDPQAIAEPFRDAILLLAGYARKRMRTEDRMFADTFDSEADRILGAADRLAGHGVDFVPAIREYRAAMDEPRDTMIDKIKPTCRGTLDRRLAAHKGR